MNAQQKSKWVKALRSDKFHQGEGCLYSYTSDTYCCLGVANAVCDLGIPGRYGKISEDKEFLPATIQAELIDFNDIDEMPFDLIAGFIDCYVEPTE